MENVSVVQLSVGASARKRIIAQDVSVEAELENGVCSSHKVNERIAFVVLHSMSSDIRSTV